MPLNLDLTKANTKRVSLGTGRLWVADYGAGNGTTPTSTDDVGLGRGGSLNITRQKAELKLGVPKALIVQYAIEETVTLGFNAVEWRPSQFVDVLGAAAYTASGGQTDTLEFGGVMQFKELSVRFVHNLAAGGTVFLDLWKAQGAGEVALNFGDDFHEIPYSFSSLAVATKWDGVAVDNTNGGSLFRMIVWIPSGFTPS